MTELLVRTKGNISPEGRSRVCFTCHPADLARTFDRICHDIFLTHDPAVYYRENMAEPLEEENRETDLARMNLFVVPVTFRLLTEPCPAMDEDIAFALKQNIPILPVLWETGLEELYQIKFGDRQYLFPFSQDPTEIRYEEKLKNYLDSVLLSEEMAKRVRAAFDAYIFLSYRK